MTIHGVARNEDGTYSWKFDNYFRSFPPRIWDPDALTKMWSRISCPTLLVRGDKSWVADPNADPRFQAFPNARNVEIENAAHWVHHDNFPAFTNAVNEFLNP